MNAQELMTKKRRGDMLLVSQMVGIDYGNARSVVQRPGARHYAEVMAALAKIIAAREALINQGRETAEK